jgi:ribulose-phosphate 3-epimerase
MTSVRIAASVMAANFARLEDELREVERAGVDLFHWDIMDGHFVPNLTFGPAVLRDLRKVVTLPFDVHLMVTTPEKWIAAFAEAGADSISIHLESEGDLAGNLKKIRDKKLQAGLVLNPETRFNAIAPEIYPLLDRILIMSVKPGFGGQNFMDVSDKIAAAAALKHSFPKLDIMVDGGINTETAPRAIAAGATTLVSGSALFGGDFGQLFPQIKGGAR